MRPGTDWRVNGAFAVLVGKSMNSQIDCRPQSAAATSEDLTEHPGLLDTADSMLNTASIEGDSTVEQMNPKRKTPQSRFRPGTNGSAAFCVVPCSEEKWYHQLTRIHQGGGLVQPLQQIDHHHSTWQDKAHRKTGFGPKNW